MTDTPTTEQLLEALPTIRASDRNKQMTREWLGGKSQKDIARDYGLSPARVSQVVRTTADLARLSLTEDGNIAALSGPTRAALAREGIDSIAALVAYAEENGPPKEWSIYNLGAGRTGEIAALLTREGYAPPDVAPFRGLKAETRMYLKRHNVSTVEKLRQRIAERNDLEAVLKEYRGPSRPELVADVMDFLAKLDAQGDDDARQVDR
jgi:predicted transcriptional regulator